jgi:outer membrane protein assembly factor BamA
MWLRLAPLLSILLFGTFLSGTPVAGQTTPAPVVSSIEFTGRELVPEETLRKALSLKPGEPFTPARLEADRKALMGLGFFRSVGAAQRTADGQTTVTFRLNEWPEVSHIRVIGNTVVESRAIHSVIRTRVGQVLSAVQLQADIRAIEQLYRERGYVARVSEKLLDEAVRSGILKFEILELRIDDVQVEGGSPSLRARARSALVELAPALYRPEAVAIDQQRLLRVRGIHNAVPHVESVGPGKVRIRWLLNPSGQPAQPGS